MKLVGFYVNCRHLLRGYGDAFLVTVFVQRGFDLQTGGGSGGAGSYSGGGGAGGGAIRVFYVGTYTNSGASNVHATGGAGGTATAAGTGISQAYIGGAGGNGSVVGPTQLVG